MIRLDRPIFKSSFYQSNENIPTGIGKVDDSFLKRQYLKGISFSF